MKSIIRFFDLLEDKIRARLSHYPLLYALIGGIGVILYWRGVWHFADEFVFLTGPVSAVIGAIILGLTGILVSAFIGNKIIIAGIRGEKKMEEKTREEILAEGSSLGEIEAALTHIEDDIAEIKKELQEKK
jgi:hypothetical protein